MNGYFLTPLRCHDVEHQLVGDTHAVSADARQIVDGLVDTLVNDALGRADALALHGQQG